MLQMKRLRKKLKDQSKKFLKDKRRQKSLPREEVQLHQNLLSTPEKTRRNKNSKNRKKESSSKSKSTEENINSDPKAPKMSIRSRRRLKSVFENLKNYFTEQDEEYFSIQETDDVFVSGKS